MVTGVQTCALPICYDMVSPTADRTVHIDQYSGKILADIRFDDYNFFGKFMASSIALHMGTLGWWSVLVNVVFCLAVIFICVSGCVAWGIRVVCPRKPILSKFPRQVGGEDEDLLAGHDDVLRVAAVEGPPHGKLEALRGGGRAFDGSAAQGAGVRRANIFGAQCTDAGDWFTRGVVRDLAKSD